MSTVKKLIFDIETIGADFDSFDKNQRQKDNHRP